MQPLDPGALENVPLAHFSSLSAPWSLTKDPAFAAVHVDEPRPDLCGNQFGELGFDEVPVAVSAS